MTAVSLFNLLGRSWDH